MASAGRDAVLRLDHRHPGSTSSLRPARTEVARFLSEGGVGPKVVERAELIVSELTTNAVNASPGRDYHLVVSIDADRRTLTIRVANRSPLGSPPPRAEWGPERPLALRGRGLAIVDAVADRVTVERSGSTVEVSAEIRLPRSRGGS